MARAAASNKTDDPQPSAPSAGKDTPPVRREIPGNLPYLTSTGTLKKILDKTIDLAKPDKFNYDFLENIVKMPGGTARACISIMKKMNFLGSDNSPTELYSRFRTDSGRSIAAYQGLKNAFPEIFKRSDYAYNVEDGKLKDIIVEITGLAANDPVAIAIKGTFNVIKSYIAIGFTLGQENVTASSQVAPPPAQIVESSSGGKQERAIGIAYNINIVLPETSDLSILNAIFKSVRENLLS